MNLVQLKRQLSVQNAVSQNQLLLADPESVKKVAAEQGVTLGADVTIINQLTYAKTTLLVWLNYVNLKV